MSEASLAFDRLHEGVQRWIWRQGWEELRDIQERSIPVLLAGDRDLVIAAATASGKTEAAFLPIVSRLASDADVDGRQAMEGRGFQAIYVSPMRALINDQFARMDGLCEELEIPVVKWHSDVSASVKQKARRSPSGILLTTPESLEAMLCLRGGDCARLFANLSHIVIDEMHAFMDAARGRQLQSLIHRIEAVSGRKPVRVGLSATLADMGMAARFLRPDDPARVEILESRDGSQELRLQVRGYVNPPPAGGARSSGADDEDSDAIGDAADREIVQHIFSTLRGKRGLIFAGSRQSVEMMASGLHQLTEKLGVPEEFFAHHGSLSREHREDAEARMKDSSRPASIVCTTTLELGIDVGHIEAVAQRGPGHTVSGMRQRVGRSGRRKGQAGVMRVYVAEATVTGKTHPVDRLRTETVQSIAMVNLMLRKWNEPPLAGRLHLSTLVHQILALITQYGGMSPQLGWRRLAQSGVFPHLTMDLYKAVLRRMGDPQVRLLEQASDGTLLLGAEGELVTTRRDFYAVFSTPEEFRVVTDRGKNLGTIPIDSAVITDQLIILTGRMWRVLNVQADRREILVTRARGGKPPMFGGSGSMLSDEVVAEMLALWHGESMPLFLDPMAGQLLEEGRENFRNLGLHESGVLRHGDQILLFPWAGGRALNALMLSLINCGLTCSFLSPAIGVGADQQAQLVAALQMLAGGPAPDAMALARLVPDKLRGKYDRYLNEALLTLDYAAEAIDAARLPSMAATLLQHH